MVILKHIMIVVLAYFHDNSGHRGVHNTIMEIKEQLDMKMLRVIFKHTNFAKWEIHQTVNLELLLVILRLKTSWDINGPLP